MLQLMKSKKLSESSHLKPIPIKVVIPSYSKIFQLPMKFSLIQKRENSMIATERRESETGVAQDMVSVTFLISSEAEEGVEKAALDLRKENLSYTL